MRLLPRCYFHLLSLSSSPELWSLTHLRLIIFQYSVVVPILVTLFGPANTEGQLVD